MNPKYKDNFIKYLLKLVPDNINQEFNFEVTQDKTGYIRINNNNIESVYLVCRPKQNSNLQGEIFIKYKFTDKEEFVFDKIYYRPDGHNEYRYNKDLKIDAIYLRGYAILPQLDPYTKKHYFEILKEWEKLDTILNKNNDYISMYQTVKNNNKVKISYVISGLRYGKKSKNLTSKTIKIIKSITDNFTIENSIYGTKGEYKDNNIIKSDPTYLIVYDTIAENIHNKLNKNKK
tara:strand:+ start:103 stop:798 length:696 start_codon:yes stop_codon:yes gene_type:complete